MKLERCWLPLEVHHKSNYYQVKQQPKGEAFTAVILIWHILANLVLDGFNFDSEEMLDFREVKER